MLGLAHTRSPLLPFLGQSFRIPLVLTRDCGEQGDRKGMEIELFEDTVDEVGSIVAIVDPVEDKTHTKGRRDRKVRHSLWCFPAKTSEKDEDHPTRAIHMHLLGQGLCEEEGGWYLVM